MLWSLVALLGSLTLQDSRFAWRWLAVYLFLTVFSGLVEDRVQVFSLELSSHVQTLFFTINFSTTTAIVFGLALYFVNKQEKVKKEIEATHHALQQSYQDLEMTKIQLEESEKATEIREETIS